ncbi:MAG: FAD-binding protein [Reyranellaceae bacterium]
MSEALASLPTRALCGFGRTRHSLARLARPQRRPQLAALVDDTEGPVLARGFGRSYGDAAHREGGLVIDMTRLDRLVDFDAGTGVLTCEAGMRLAEIDRLFAARGFCVPVVPGTAWVSVGGAIAADIHGKNHDQAGSFGDHVEWIDLLTADGNLRRIDALGAPAVFAATIGGMGTTGIIVQAALRLQRETRSAIAVRQRKLTDLDALLVALAGHRAGATYSVAWVDAMARGRHLGRAVLEIGEPADGAPATGERRARRLPAAPPDWLPLRLIGRAFNAAWLARLPAAGRDRVLPRERFFYPLDAIADWNRVYGSSGFHQFQCVLPDAHAPEGLRRMLEATSASRVGCLLAVLKTMGRAGRGYLSFAMPGHTLALDIPARADAGELLATLERIALECGGRVYLAKDAALSAEGFAAMYPELPRQRAVLAQIDPQSRFASDLSRRLALHEATP